MNTAALLPQVPRPPHDPHTWRLDSQAGWHEAKLDGIELSPLGQALTLAPAPAGASSPLDSSGSFGGLTLPANVALGPDGSVFLLDRQTALLKLFDPCTCRFENVPCTGGVGEQPRQLRDARSIGILGGNLFICDTGNRRLQVFALHGFVLRSIWGPPAASAWQPNGIAFAHHGRVLVSDPAHGSVHVFNFAGRWLKRLEGLGAITAIAVDCTDRLYVQVEGEDRVKVVDLNSGDLLESVSRLDQIAARFPKLPFPVTAAGQLVLGGLCQAVGVAPPYPPGLFDLTGTPMSGPAETVSPVYLNQGVYISEALDSDLYRCSWDRLILRAHVPEGSRIKVLSYTSETALPFTLIQTLPDDAWAPCPTLHPGQVDTNTGDWDCLLQSAPGRFLYLQFVFQGNGTVTPRLERLDVQFPRISLRRYLPGVFGAEPLAADFTDRFLAVFDRTFRSIETELDNQARLFDPLSAPAGKASEGKDFLSWLGSWVGIALERHWPLERRRLLLKEAGTLFSKRGTLAGLQRYLYLYFGLESRDHSCPTKPAHCGPCTTEAPYSWQPPPLILEHFKLRRWLFLNHGRLGEQARLWGQKIVNRSQLGSVAESGSARLGVSQLKTTQDPLRDPFHVYAHKFTVFAPACYAHSPAQRKGLERLLEMEKPAHTAYQIVYVEPRFRIGIQSMIGFDTVIGCYTEGITVEQSLLGRATVLSPAVSGGPTLRIGQEARVGTTTKLS